MHLPVVRCERQPETASILAAARGRAQRVSRPLLALAGGDAYRIRVGLYRIVYTIEDRRLVVEVVRVAHRKEVCK